MEFQVGEYLIATVGKTDKKKLVKVEKVRSSGNLNVVVDDHNMITAHREDHKIEPDQVLCNLGMEPIPGTAFGIRIEPFVQTIEIKPWGQVHFYRKVTSSEQKRIVHVFEKVGERLKRKELFAFQQQLEIHVRPPHGMYSGTYTFKPGDDRLDLLTWKPADLIDDPFELLYHESGHGVYWRSTSKSYKARWIDMYHRCVKLEKADAKEVERLGKDFLETSSTVGDYKKGLAEDSPELALFSECIDWIGDNHRLRVRDLNTLIEANSDIMSIWPSEEMMLSNIEPIVTKYATKNVDEFFAESFAFYMTKKDIPSGVSKLMKKTLAKITGGE